MAAATVTAAFEEMLRQVTPSEAVTAKAKKHRDSLEACLRRNFRVQGFFQTGSYGHGTNISGMSDIDYFLVMPQSDVPSDSGRMLRKVRDALERRYFFTDIRVRSPAVIVQFGTDWTERYEITPAVVEDDSEAHVVYRIPETPNGWRLSAPRGHNAYVTDVNERHKRRVKPVIRLVKLWNGACGAGLRSIYLELRTAKLLDRGRHITYPEDTAWVLHEIMSTELAALRDPLKLTGLIAACTEAQRRTALSKLQTAAVRAEKALMAEERGDIREAFDWWRRVFPRSFPAYSRR